MVERRGAVIGFACRAVKRERRNRGVTNSRRAAYAGGVDNLARQIERAIIKRGLLADGEAALVAVSGGLDSMALLHLLHRLASRHDWRLRVAHFNHQLRGKESRADDRLVAETARGLGLEHIRGSGRVRATADAEGLSLEMAARRLRHAFLARAARRLGIAKVLLAQHADDNTELFFLRLLRGSGGDGLSGMKWLSPSPADAQVQLVRPLLECTKAELEAWAKGQGIIWREDASNGSPDIPRNRIRHELLPLLRDQYQPGLNQAVRRLMEIVGDEAELAESAAAQWLAAPEGKPFSGLPVALQRRCLRILLRRQGIEAGWEHVEALRLNPGKPLAIGSALWMRRTSEGRLESVPASKPAQFEQAAGTIRLRGAAGEFSFGGRAFAWRIVRHAPGFDWRAKPANTEYFDAKLAGREFTLRHWRPGDVFQPIGLGQPAKLQDLFMNRRIPREQRRRLVLAENSEGRIFWVEGLRIGEEARLRAGTTRRLELSWRIEN